MYLMKYINYLNRMKRIMFCDFCHLWGVFGYSLVGKNKIEMELSDVAVNI